MVVNWKHGAVAGGLFAAFVLMAKCQRDASQRALGASQEQVRVLRHERDSLKVLKDSLAKASVAQIETLRVAVIRRVPIIDSVRVLLRDTVPIPVEVVREVIRADSAVIEACTVALGTCEAEKSVLRLDIVKAEQERDIWHRRAQPSLWDQVKQIPGKAITSTALMSVGYAACRIGGL